MVQIKSFFYCVVVLSFLAFAVSCACANPVQTTDEQLQETNVEQVVSETNAIELPANMFVLTENTVLNSVLVGFNIFDHVNSNDSLNFENASVRLMPGADQAIFNVSNLSVNLITGDVRGSIKLNRRLDYENPIDADTNNDYEAVVFDIGNATETTVDNNGVTNVSNATLSLSIIIRITDLKIEPRTLEILIDSHHFSTDASLRGIKEVYLYENAFDLDPDPTGRDSNDFFLANLISNTNVVGELYPGSDLAKLYDQIGNQDAFLTAINGNSNVYHRLTFNFKENVNLRKIAISGREVSGYEGFVFCIRDENGGIIYTHIVSGASARNSVYSFIPNYNLSIYPITNFDIVINNTIFDIAENTYRVLTTGDFSVRGGYEYERGFVSFAPGADIGVFNTDNVYFIGNELMGLSFKSAPNFEITNDNNRDGFYEVGAMTISNIDGGQLTPFSPLPLRVRVVNVPKTVSLLSNTLFYVLPVGTSNIIENLTDLVTPSNFDNALSLGNVTYQYELDGPQASYFEVIGNTLKTTNQLGLSKRGYNLQIHYIAERDLGGTVSTQTLDITIRAEGWYRISRNERSGRVESDYWSKRHNFQTVVLDNNDLLVVGGDSHHFSTILGLPRYKNDVWLSKNYGRNWVSINNNAPWTRRAGHQCVVLPNKEILIMGGQTAPTVSINDVWRSTNGGTNWNFVTDAPWTFKTGFEAVVLSTGEILVMGGGKNEIWRSADNGITWSQVPASNHWIPRIESQVVVLANDDILIMGGYTGGNVIKIGGYVNLALTIGSRNGYANDVWSSSDGGSNWENIVPNGNDNGHWSRRAAFQTVVRENDDILVMGGFVAINLNWRNDVWLSTNGGRNWQDITSPNNPYGGLRPAQSVSIDHLNHDHWAIRQDLQAVSLLGDSKISRPDILILGGHASLDLYSDVWGMWIETP